jgi:hypothetical protein
MLSKIKNFFVKYKTNILFIGAIFLLSAVILLPLLFNTSWSGDIHDLKTHLVDIRAMCDAWDNRQFGTRIFPLIQQDFGYATGIAYSMFPSAIAAIFIKVFGMSVRFALFSEILLLFFISGLVVYTLIKRITGKKHIAVISACVYILFPYNLTNVYARFAFAEMFIMLIIPLIAWSLYELFTKDNYKLFLPLFVIGFSLSLFFHSILTVYIFIFVLIYCLLNYKKLFGKYYFLPIGAAGFISLLITSFYWLPLFVNYRDLWLSGLGVDSGFRMLEISLKNNTQRYDFIGLWILYLPILITAFVLFVKNKKKNYEKKLLFLILLVTAMTTPIFVLWAIFPKFLLMLQFPSRLFIFFALFFALMTAYIFIKRPKNKILISCVCGFLALYNIVQLPIFWYNLTRTQLIEINSSINAVSGLPEGSGAGAGVYTEGPPSYVGMDYYPKNGDKIYTVHRANKTMIVDQSREYVDFEEHLKTPYFIRDLANYQSQNCLQFEVSSTHEDDWVVLNIPFAVYDDAAIFQFDFLNQTDITAAKPIEPVTYPEYAEPLLKINFTQIETLWAKVVIKYEDNSKLEQYLRQNPFEFIDVSADNGLLKAANFIKTGINYTVDFEIGKECTIELPTFYYKGYELTYTNTNGETYKVAGVSGQYGFIEVTLAESGTLNVKYTGSWFLSAANIICIIGLLLFIVLLIIIYITPQKKEKKTNDSN